MNKKIFAVLLCAAFASPLQAQTAPAPQQPARAQAGASADYRATRDYYAALIAGPSPRLVELTLLMNLLPKGGDLHHHFSGAIYAETYVAWLKDAGYCVYRPEAGDDKAYTIETRPKELPDAQRAHCLGTDEILDARNDRFYRELLMRWSDKDYGNHAHDQPPPDRQFFNTFPYFGAISTHDYNKALRHLKARAQAENLQYIETMMRGAPSSSAVSAGEPGKRINTLAPDADAAQADAAFAPLFDTLAGDANVQAGITAYLRAIDAAAAGIDDDTFKLRFQAYVSRNNPPAQVFAGLYAGFAAAAASAAQGGKLVAVNIVGPENMHVAMRDYRLHMHMFRFLKTKFPNVRLALHAGELTLGMVPPEGLQSHIRDAIEIAGALRIGHGVDIAHERDAAGLLRLMRARSIPVEISLTSNAFILGVQGAAHPLALYRRFGVPYVIATDDPGVSRNNLAGEYVLFASRHQPSYDELKRAVYNSLRYSFLGEAEKMLELRKLDVRFADFEAKVREIARGR